MSPIVPPFPDEHSRAILYPYDAPDHSYLLHQGHLLDFDPKYTQNKKPLLCIGSNIAPMQLLRKYGDKATIAVQRAWLTGYDSVFGARFAPYGAMPAMLEKSSGTDCFLAIAWLDDSQLEMMDITEKGGYHRTSLDDISLTTLEGDLFESIPYYQQDFPSYKLNDHSVAIATITAKDRQLVELSCAQILNVVYQDILEEYPDISFEQFIKTLADDATFRDKITEQYLQS